MGNAYTTSAKVLDEVHADVPSSVTSLIAGWIEDESRYVDSVAVAYTRPFNAITGSPVTPPIVEKATRFLVVDRVFRKLGLLRYDDAGRVVESYRAEGERMLRMLRDGDLVIPEAQL